MRLSLVSMNLSFFTPYVSGALPPSSLPLALQWKLDTGVNGQRSLGMFGRVGSGGPRSVILVAPLGMLRVMTW